MTKHTKISSCPRINVFLKNQLPCSGGERGKNRRLNIYTVQLQVSYETTKSLNIFFRLQWMQLNVTFFLIPFCKTYFSWESRKHMSPENTEIMKMTYQPFAADMMKKGRRCRGGKRRLELKSSLNLQAVWIYGQGILTCRFASAPH